MAKSKLEVKAGDSRPLLANWEPHLTGQGNERATYGEQIVATLSRQSVADFGRLPRSIFAGGKIGDTIIERAIWSVVNRSARR
jgi:hypothetical protein